MSKRPNIFTYTQYRDFLRDLYDYLKETKPVFSHRYFSKKAGFSSPNNLKLVMEGKRSLTTDSIQKFAKALQLNNQESEFFEALVQFNQATDTDVKATFFERMTQCRRFREINQLKKETFQFYSKWYHVVIREMVTLAGFRSTPGWIAKRLYPRISPTQVNRSIKLLLKLGLLKKERQQLKQADPIIATPAEVQSVAITKFHREMFKLADNALTQLPGKERDITSATLGLPKKHLPEVKKMIESFRLELLTKFESSAHHDDEIFQLNIQLFPVTQKNEGEEKK